MAYPQGYGHDERVQGVVANLMATDSGSVCFTRLQEPSPQAMVPEDGNLKHSVFFYCQKYRYMLSGQARHPNELPWLPSALPWSFTIMA